ncbi:MAG: molybdopterin-binding protein, partial [Brachybacterium sp.]
LIGLARTLGIAQVPVRAPLRIAVVVTGDELTADDAHQAEGTVRESNGTMLAAALTAAGCEARVLRSGDEPAALAEVLADAEESADLVLTTGGIGHGAYDVVKALLGPRGTGTSCFVHLALRPGGPQGAGRLPGGTPVVHLPGTPVGALVGHHLFVRQLLPGGGSPPHAVGLEDPTGLVARSRRREGLVVLAGRLATGPQGAPLVRLLPGRRLAPYGRADALVLGGAAACTGIEDSALVMPL